VNRTERAILGPIITAIRRFNGNAWWELKRQIWDGGFQPYYPAQGDFYAGALLQLSRLDVCKQDQLRAEWRKRDAAAPESMEAVLEHYAHVVVEELVHRAAAAAYRTVNW
jgi:hypothetical protein